MPECQLCGSSAKLVRSHTIPEAFFREADTGMETPRLYTNVEGRYPKRAPIGVYDRFACAKCESRFQSWDDYAIRLFIRDFAEFEKTSIDQETAFLQLEDYLYKDLKLFFISHLLRAHLSSQDFYGRVELGRYFQEVKNLVLAENPGEIDDFSITLSRWRVGEDREEFAKALVSPFRERWDGVNAYRFYLGLTVAYIKVDKRSFRSPFRDVAMSPNRPLYVIERVFENSKDFAALKMIARATSEI